MYNDIYIYRCIQMYIYMDILWICIYIYTWNERMIVANPFSLRLKPAVLKVSINSCTCKKEVKLLVSHP